MNKTHDFTEGNIAKQMVFFSLPIFLTNLLQTSYQFIDSIWVGNLLGANALGAISIAAPVIFTVLSFIIGVNSATLTVLSQRKGASDQNGLIESLNAFVVALTILSVLFGIIGFIFTDPILKFLGTPDEIFESTKVYLRINFLGILFLFGYNFIGTVLRALGDSKTPIRFVLFAVILNTVLDPLFISYFNWGIEGAAYATILSQGAAFLYGVIYSVWKSKIPFTIPHLPDSKEIKRISKLGIPAGLQMMTVSAGVTAIMGIVASFGTQVVAGFGAAQRLDRIIMLPAFTLGAAVNSMAGQNIGSGKWGRVSAISKNGIILILSVSLTISAIIFFSAESMIRLFINDPETIAFGENYLKTVAFFYPFLGINFVLNGVVKAAGAMVQVLVLNIISFWVLRVPLTYLFSKWLGAEGIAYGIGVSFIISSLFAIAYYRYGKWREIDLFEGNQETSDDKVPQKKEWLNAQGKYRLLTVSCVTMDNGVYADKERMPSLKMKRFLFYVVGLFVLTAGITLTIKSDIGAGAWDALNVGLSETIGFTVGSWVIIVGVILIIVNAILMRAWPDFFALITIIVTGLFIDFWLLTLFADWTISDVFIAYAVFAIGMILVGLGIAIYLQAKFAVIPIDGLMLAIHHKTGLSIRTSKTIGELIALVAAVILGGPIGIGTLAITFGIGPLVQFFYPTFEKMNA